MKANASRSVVGSAAAGCSLMLGLFSTACSTAPAMPHRPPVVSTASVPSDAPSPPIGNPPLAVRRLFDFHSGPWVNLHHVLYVEARKREGIDEGEGDSGMDPASVDASMRPAWDAALDYYAENIAKRDLTFDDGLAAINTELSARETASNLRAVTFEPELARLLEAAMPVYEARGWFRDDRANRAWITSTYPFLEGNGEWIARDLADAYQTTWPDEPLRVDVTRVCNWSGAYTTLGPAHLTIAATDPRNLGTARFEILFHEASHQLVRPLRDAFSKALEAEGKEARDLWHAVLFYTTGAIVAGYIKGHVPYAHEHGLWTRGDWVNYRAALDKYWKPYLDGKQRYEIAVRQVVRAL